MSALTRAVREGQTLTRVDAGNVDAALAAADLGEDAEASVLAGVGSGRIAWIHQSQLLHETWDAAGYVLEDPATGAGGYFVTYERLLTGLDADISFQSPQDLDVVTEPTDVVATIDSEHEVTSWTLSYKAADGGEATVLATGSRSVTGETLAPFDPTLLLNGLYDIVLTARDALGQTASERISVVVEGQMKIGHFTLSFVDLAIPVSGLDIEIVRTYDSRDKQPRDFGVSWSLDIRQGSYRNNRAPGDGWQLLTGILPCDTVLESKSHLTVVRLSDQEVYRFALRLENGVPSTGGGCFANARFDFVDGPVPGATLEILGQPQVFYETGSDQVIDVDTFEPYEPKDVRLTTRDGRTFELDLNDGVILFEGLNGNQLAITPAGITHSSGKGIVFERDTEGRITRITDPLAQVMVYAYDAAGDLASFTDQEGYVDQFTYDEFHRLTELENPRGNAARNEYDEDGRLIRTIDPLGNIIELTHELEGRRELLRDRRGFTRIYEYDQRGNITELTNASGKVTLRTYGAKDELLSETDPLGSTISYTYDESLDLVSAIDPLGKVKRWAYNSVGKPLKITDANGNETDYTYDHFGNLTSTIDALGNLVARTYDSNGNMSTVTDAAGNVTGFQYNEFGEVKKRTDALGNTTGFEYDLSGNLVAETKTLSTEQGDVPVVRSFQYDRLGRLTGMTDAEGAVVSTRYDGMNNTLSATNALGQTTEFAYDAVDRLAVVTDPDGFSMQQIFNAEGKVTRRVGRDGKAIDIGYNPSNDLVSVTLPGELSSSNILDDLGRLVGIVDANGVTSSFDLDANGRVLRAVHAGRETLYSRDANGNVLSMTAPGGQTTSLVYDALNRIVGVTASNGTAVQTTYGPTGLVTSRTGPLGRTVNLNYDPIGRMTAVADAAGNTTSYVYDQLGFLTARTDAGGRSTRMEYDKAGRVTKRILADGKFETMEYDQGGGLVARTDFAGRRVDLRYGPYGPVLERSSENDGAILYAYTASGKIASVVDHRGTTSYAYDEPGRLSELIYPDGRSLSYGYDGTGRVTRMTVHIGGQEFETSYAYDASGRLVTTTDPAGGLYSCTYTVAGSLETLSYPNGVVTTYVYDGVNRLTGLESRNAEGDVIQSYEYVLDAGGRQTLINEDDGITREPGYDDLDRLVNASVNRSGDLIHQSVFSYDSVGNRLGLTRTDENDVDSITYEYDQRDRLLAADGTTFTWDANGNLTSRTDSEGVTVYTWDDYDRLRSVVLPDDVVVVHDYDVDGRRSRTEVTEMDGLREVREYLVDSTGWVPRVVAETDASGVLISLNVYGPGIGPVSMIRPGGVRYLHADGLGSTRVLTDEEGAVTDRYSYLAFGELEEHVGVDSNPYLFTGAAFDSQTNLYDLHARWMDPRTGRFLSMDPVRGSLTEPVTQHSYLYAGADPVNRLDPDGRFYLSLALIFGLIQKPPKKKVIKIRQNYYPIFIRVRPIIRSGSEWAASDAMRLIDRAADVLSRAAGILPVYSGNAPEYSARFEPELTEVDAEFWMMEYFQRQRSGDGRTIPMLFFNELEYSDLSGFSTSPELDARSNARGVALPRLRKFLLSTTYRGILTGSFDQDWSLPFPVNCELVAAHELGHALGVNAESHTGHSESSGLLMSDGNCESTEMPSGEVSAARSVAWTLR
ncbi:MAG: hypothetical protein GY722_14995 [bacterium]|nr:hypothetical protein [bacterium]